MVEDVKAEGWEPMPTKGENMDIPDSYVDDYFYLAEKTDTKCPECRCFLTVDPDTETAECPKCGWKEEH